MDAGGRLRGRRLRQFRRDDLQGEGRHPERARAARRRDGRAFQTQNIPNDGSIAFGSATRQMLNLYGEAYGVGVQPNVLYHRSGRDARMVPWRLS